MAHFTHKKLGQAGLDKPGVEWGVGGGCHGWQTDCQCLEAPNGQKKQRESCLAECTGWCMGGADAGLKAQGSELIERGLTVYFFLSFLGLLDPAGPLPPPAGSVKPCQKIERQSVSRRFSLVTFSNVTGSRLRSRMKEMVRFKERNKQVVKRLIFGD